MGPYAILRAQAMQTIILKSKSKKGAVMQQDYINKNYSVTDTASVILSITIGNAQIGGSAVKNGTTVIATGQISNLNLGTGQSLKNASVLAVTTVSDINQNTNNLVVTYDVTGGPQPYSESRMLTVDNNGDAGRFVLVLNFS